MNSPLHALLAWVIGRRSPVADSYAAPPAVYRAIPSKEELLSKLTESDPDYWPLKSGWLSPWLYCCKHRIKFEEQYRVAMDNPEQHMVDTALELFGKQACMAIGHNEQCGTPKSLSESIQEIIWALEDYSELKWKLARSSKAREALARISTLR